MGTEQHPDPDVVACVPDFLHDATLDRVVVEGSNITLVCSCLRRNVDGTRMEDPSVSLEHSLGKGLWSIAISKDDKQQPFVMVRSRGWRKDLLLQRSPNHDRRGVVVAGLRGSAQSFRVVGLLTLSLSSALAVLEDHVAV